jgi:hypothetical protein
VNVDNTAPSATITSPKNGSHVSRYETISVSATDNVSVARIGIYVDNILVKSCTGALCSHVWDTGNAAAGDHVITASAWDSAGNLGHSPAITVKK